MCKICEEKPVINIQSKNYCKVCFFKMFKKKVRKTISKFKLFNKGDKIAVAVSGGKDSTVCLHVLKELGYNIEGITVDAHIGNYTKENLENLKGTCEKYNVNLHVINFRDEFGASLCYIRDAVKSKGYDYSSCMICGVLRRYLLNKYSKKLKFDCIATGHCLDDEAQAVLMNIFRNDQKLILRQGPISGEKTRKDFVKRVKPLYLCSEKEIIVYSKLMKFPVVYTRCPCSVEAYRRNFRDFLDGFEEKHPSVKHNIINFYLDFISSLKGKSSGKIQKCKICKEPSSGEICKKCQILSVLKK